MAKTKFPSIKDVANDLRLANKQVEGSCDVRLQVSESGSWEIRVGDASYDLDHRGYWGASGVPGDGHRFNSIETARELLDQAKDQYHCCQEND
jgi:hypothetical protein